jgi:hypothetical protein
MLKAATASMSRVQGRRPSPRRILWARALMMLALYLPLVLMVTIGPMIANADHFHQRIAHGPEAQVHHHLDVIAQAEMYELGTHHVHLSDSLQLNALVADNSHTHHHANRNLINTNPMIDYADVFPDGLLRPPRI